MSKLRFCIRLIVLALLTTNSYSQSFNFKPSTTRMDQTNTPLYSEPLLPVTSPNNFKSDVKSRGQQTQSNLDQQLKQSLRPMPVKPPAEPPPPPPNAPGANLTPPKTPRNTDMESRPLSPAETSSTPGAIQGAQGQPPTPTTAPSPRTPPPAPYTGFGAGSNQSNTGGGTEQPRGGGWNIKY